MMISQEQVDEKLSGYLTKDEARRHEKAQSTSLWLNRTKGAEHAANGNLVKPMHVYIGETGKGLPTYDEPVADMQQIIDGINTVADQRRSGSIPDYGKITQDPFIGEWKAIAQEYDARVRHAGANPLMRSAAVGTDSDFAAIDVVNVMATMVNTELRTFVLERALPVIGTPQLTINVDTFTRFTAETGVPEGVMPTTKRAGATRALFNLTKDVSTIAMTDESQLRLVHDMWRQQIDNATTDFKRIKANKIATTLEAAPNPVTGADWTAFTTDHNTNSPFKDIGSTSDTIFANNGSPNVITSHDKTWRGYTQSTYVKGVLQAIPLPNMSMAKVITDVPGMPGFTWYTDNEHTSTIAMIFDPAAVAMFQGPVKTEQYRLSREGVDGFVYRDWNLPAILVPGRIRKVTGVVT